ncbi:MAG: PhzF family phenazine biosynthesis protein [Chloroflexi bacterium HGW-Chloroflexi-10]|nr:MAG: PhzF family phenazine biosynthesis protein [Chloroflexi bacterium HGW-Chloroflexi-10]
MKTYPFMQVDAFTTRALGGNPCAVFFNTEDLDDTVMLAITREMNLSESAFVRPSQIADFGVRYFTPMGEIPLAGHPTIATVYALVFSGRLALQGESTRIQLELKVGPIPVEITAKDGKVQHITMNQKKPQFQTVFDPADVLPVFGLTEEDILPGFPIQTISTGTPQLMICVKNLDALKKMNTNSQAYSALHSRSDWFSTHIFCLGGITPAGQTFARHLSPPPDIFEDPFTGSATGGMAAYLWHYGLLKEPTFTAEQGHWMARPGQAAVEVVGLRENIETVRVGGPAVTVLTGSLHLPDRL